MIVGNGMIATKFKKYEDKDEVLIYASGVSNSNETKYINFSRELKMVQGALKNFNEKQFIYFSSCSLEDIELKNTPYHLHKKNIEVLIQQNSRNYLIFRLPNIIGTHGNDETLVNYFIKKIQNNEKFEIWKNSARNIVAVDDLLKIVSHIIDNDLYHNTVINISYDHNVSILDLVAAIEEFVGVNAIYSIKNKGVGLNIDNKEAREIMNKLKISQPDILELIKRYKKI